MIIIARANATPDDIQRIQDVLKSQELRSSVNRTLRHIVVAVAGPEGGARLRELIPENDVLALPGVERVLYPNKPYVFSSRDVQPEPTTVDLGDETRIGENEPLTLIAGPCSVESEDQVLRIARAAKQAGATILRGGLFKPRTSPFSFQGLGKDGFKLMADVRAETGLKFVTEAMDEASLDLVVEHADVIQIGSRNMHNSALLKAAGETRAPVLLKRGFSATLSELLQAADYVLNGGNENVVLCERGIRTFDSYSRNTLDLSLVPAIRRQSHLPVIVDPSHATGHATLVPSMALAAAASGADGIMIEIHDAPEQALSDGQQALTLQAYAELTPRIVAVAEAAGRPVATPSALS